MLIMSNISNLIMTEKKEMLSFPDALKAIIEGHYVTKQEWKDGKIIVFLDGCLKITLSANEYKPTPLILSEADLLGEDWYIVS